MRQLDRRLYDHVIVVEPARIAGAEARGLQRLYVEVWVATLTALRPAAGLSGPVRPRAAPWSPAP